MKLIIVLKKTDAEGYGGEILETMGMRRSDKEPGVFAVTMPVHDPGVFGTGDSSWSLPEAKSLVYVEALTDAGVRPMRVYQWTDSTAGLTPLHASTWVEADEDLDQVVPQQTEQRPVSMGDPSANENDLIEVEDAMAAVGLAPLPGEQVPSDSIPAALQRLQHAANRLNSAVDSSILGLDPSDLKHMDEEQFEEAYVDTLNRAVDLMEQIPGAFKKAMTNQELQHLKKSADGLKKLARKR